jgi:hypothetical protein
MCPTIFQVFRDGAWIVDLETRSMRKILDDATAEEFAWHPLGHRVAYANAPSLINYNIARIHGERVSTAHVESTVNSLVNWRMGKKQQMSRSPLGAQRLLHVRTAIANGRLHRYTGLPVTTDGTTTVPSPTRMAA